MDRTTYCVTDSLLPATNTDNYNYAIVAPVKKPRAETVPAGYAREILASPHSMANAMAYTEAQYHGTLAIEDIQEVIFTRIPSYNMNEVKAEYAKLQASLTEKGIKWRQLQ